MSSSTKPISSSVQDNSNRVDTSDAGFMKDTSHILEKKNSQDAFKSDISQSDFKNQAISVAPHASSYPRNESLTVVEEEAVGSHQNFVA